MPAPDFSPDFETLRQTLLASGTAPTIVERTVLELGDHFADLLDAGMAGGANPRVAARSALVALGDLGVLAGAVRLRPELKSWAWRWPRLACAVYPVAYLAALPAVPFLAGARHSGELVRWLGGIVVSAALTMSLFFVLQLAISAG